MTTRISLFLFIYLASATFYSDAIGQLEMKLQLIDDNTWGVYVQPVDIAPSSNTITGSGQVTVVMPTGFQWSNLICFSGSWINNETVISPQGNIGRTYVSFGLQAAEPTYPINYQAGLETLLFTFDGTGACPDSLYLIDCGSSVETDPFCPPNSANSNPGNDLSVIDFDLGPAFYNYSDNYAPSAWSCNDCDNDGFPDALEDTNGNGIFDPGIDSSDLCDPCDPSIPAGSGYVENVVVCDGLPVAFWFNFQNPGATSVAYQWQISYDSGNSWNDLSEGPSTIGGGVFGGVKTDSLTFVANAGLNGTQFRLRITTDQCTYFTDSASFNLQAEDHCNFHLGCLELSLRLLANEQGWGVYIRPDDQYQSSQNIDILDGRFNIVSPQNFSLVNLTSFNGTWAPVPTTGILPNQPGMVYRPIVLESNDPPLKLEAGVEKLLFTFERVGNCPDTLYLLGKTPPGILPNSLTGYNPDFPMISNFNICGIYDPEAWACPMLNGQTVEDRSNGEVISGERNSQPSMQLSPNPADDFLRVTLDVPEAHKALNLILYAHTGEVIHKQKADIPFEHHIDLSFVPPGLYILTLETDGKVVERKRFVKK